MKQRILHIITTIVTVVVVVTSLSLPAAASDVFVEYFPIDSATMVVNGDTINPYDLEISDSRYITTGSVVVSGTYDQYLGARSTSGIIILTYDETKANIYGINLDYGDNWDKFDKSNINYIQLRFGIIVPQGWNTDSVSDHFLTIARNGSSLAHRYTISTVFSSPISAVVGTSSFGYYREVICDVLFDDDLQFNQDDIITFGLPYCPIVPFVNSSTGNYVGMYYNNGFDNLAVGYVSTNQYLEQISVGIGEINDNIDEGNEILLDISDKLNEELTDDQQALVDEITGKIEESESKGDYVEDNINDLASIADENAYSFVPDELQTIIDDNIQPVLDDEGFALFTEELYENIWIMISIPLVLFFVLLRYVIYGVH